MREQERGQVEQTPDEEGTQGLISPRHYFKSLLLLHSQVAT